jgi:hypothetical protein
VIAQQKGKFVVLYLSNGEMETVDDPSPGHLIINTIKGQTRTKPD